MGWFQKQAQSCCIAWLDKGDTGFVLLLLYRYSQWASSGYGLFDMSAELQKSSSRTVQALAMQQPTPVLVYEVTQDFYHPQYDHD